ncbi:hypothetical protein [Oscillibacter sp.]|uniref:hypothetical protein n=1 Tax=Oscillibacter sp. TaxID=1945593 RepID=UPI0028AB9C7A|nr:hypothetical protein [Oscillibacter sp.]
MKKKMMSLALALVMCLSLCVPAFAADSNVSLSGATPEMIGVLTTEDGAQHIIEGTLVSMSPLTRSIGNNNSVTYKYDLPASLRASGSTTESDHDGAIASTVYLTINYAHQNTPTEYLLTSVSGHWVITDQKASVESATVSYGCSGLFPRPTTQSVLDRSVANYFNISTSFTNYVASDTHAVMGANLTVNYLMGTAWRWSFTLTNILFNN